MIEDKLITKQEGASAINTPTGGRIFTGIVPQQAQMPCTSLSRIGQIENVLHHAGSGGICRALFQISCWAATPLAAKGLALAVRQLFDGLSDDSGTGILLAEVVNEVDLFDEELEVFHVPVDISVLYRVS